MSCSSSLTPRHRKTHRKRRSNHRPLSRAPSAPSTPRHYLSHHRKPNPRQSIYVGFAGGDCLAGPVVACASYSEQDKPKDCAFAETSVRQIDKTNVVAAKMSAGERAVELLRLKKPCPRGTRVMVKGLFSLSIDLPCTATLDQQIHPAVEEANHKAECYRKKKMLQYHQRFPEWGFNQHYGKPTPEHRQLVVEQAQAFKKQRQSTTNVNPLFKIYRRSFTPLKRFAHVLFSQSTHLPPKHRDTALLTRIKRRK